MTQYSKIDIHNHWATTNKFKERDFNRIVDTVEEKLGKGGIAGIVNIGTFSSANYEKIIGFEGYDRVDLGNAVYVPEKDVLLIKAQEIPTKQGHLFVVGLPARAKIRDYTSLENTINEAKCLNAIIIADHPFGRSGIGPYLKNNIGLLEKIDGLEIHNGESALPIFGNPRNANQKAIEFYREIKLDFPHLAPIVSSDGHNFYEVGSNWIEIIKPNIKNSETLNDSLRENLRSPIKIKKHNSYVGTFEHAIKLGAIMKLKSLFRIDFERLPENE